MMKPRQAVVAFVVLIAAGGCASALWWYWTGDTGPQRVSELKTKLLSQSADKTVSERKIQRTSESLMREFDQLTPGQQKSAQEELRTEAHERMLASAREWQQLPEDERAAFLEVKIAEGAKWRRVFGAMYADNVPRVAKRFLKEYAESEDAKTEEKKVEGGDSKKPDAKRGDGSRRGDRRGRDGRGRGPRGDRNDEDETDPDKLLIRDFYRAIGQHMRAKGGQRSGRAGRGPGA
jgi:hypothetical protein